MTKLIRSSRAYVAWGHDVVMAALSFGIALYLRVGSDAFGYYADRYLLTGVVLFTAVAGTVFIFTGLYRGIWRYASLDDMMAIVKAVTLTILIFLPIMFVVTRLEGFPRSQPFINWFVLVALLGGPRIVYRVVRDRRFDTVFVRERDRRIPVLLIGASDECELFLRALRRQRNGTYRPVGILAEKERRVGRHIHGVKVLGTIADLDRVVAALTAKRDKPHKVILTKERLSTYSVKDLYQKTEALGITMARSQRPGDLRSGLSDAVELRPIAIEDLLGRPQTVLDRPAMRALIAGRRVLVTGAGGSIGSELVRQISDLAPARLALLDNSEFHLSEIDRALHLRHPELPRREILADVRDARRIEALFAEERPELVFHAAALKHVPMVELHPVEGALTNVVGTRNVADACRRAGVGTMVQISTDKAVNPSNVMGATKRLAECYCQALDIAGAGGRSELCFVTVRFGNVLGSTGSVVPLFQQQLATGGPLTVTHPDVSRYFMTIREAVELVLMASTIGAARPAHSGKIYVLDMGEAIRIEDLARQMIRLAGLVPDADVKIEYVGLRPGEKLAEELLHASESLVESGQQGILLAAPRTADAKLLAQAIDKLERDARAGHTDAVREALRRLVPEYRPSATEPRAAAQ
jgi:FlaA1/EpsC-like NDP-sugar epimerase